MILIKTGGFYANTTGDYIYRVLSVDTTAVMVDYVDLEDKNNVTIGRNITLHTQCTQHDKRATKEQKATLLGALEYGLEVFK